MTQLESRFAYAKGDILVNKGTLTFRFMGKHYATNKNRKKNYHFKHHNWRIDSSKGLAYKLWAICTLKVHKLKQRKD